MDISSVGLSCISSILFQKTIRLRKFRGRGRYRSRYRKGRNRFRFRPRQAQIEEELPYMRLGAPQVHEKLLPIHPQSPIVPLGAVFCAASLPGPGSDSFPFCHGQWPSTSTVKVHPRNVRTATRLPSSAMLFSVKSRATVRMMSAATRSSRPTRSVFPNTTRYRS